MQYAKINNGQILKFPYTMEALREDNPTTIYDDRFTVLQWFAQTEEATRDGAEVVEVLDGVQPSFDPATQKLSLQDTPVFENGTLVFPWVVIARTQEEIAYYNSVMEAGRNLST